MYFKFLICLFLFVTYRNVSCQNVQRAIRQFTNNIIEETERKTRTNFVLSPFSIHSAFSMVLLGSGRTTKSQLERVLGTRVDTAREGYTRLNRRLLDQQNSVGADLRLANKVFVAHGFSPKQDYKQLLQNGFNSGIEGKDFGNGKTRSVQEINDYVSQATSNKIRDLLSDDSVNSDTRMILINAIYFKAPWKEAFSSQETLDSTFKSPSGEVEVPTMMIETKLRVLEDKTNKLKVVELPYGNSNKSMLIILPDEGENDGNIAKTLSKIDLPLIRQQRPDTTRVFLPRFKMQFQSSLKSTMQNLGATDLFNQNADLSGISDLPLYVSDGIHQSFIEVNEEGTEAAAATAILFDLRSDDYEWTRAFRANRPFIFMVWDFDENIPIFAGKLVDPTNSVLIQKKSALGNDRPGAVGASEEKNPTLKPVTQAKAFCRRYFRDFANSLDNAEICDRQKNNMEWIAVNVSGCNKRWNIVSNFNKNNCGAGWCGRFGGQKAAKEKEFRGRCNSQIPTGSDRIYCRSIQNHLNAHGYLKC